MSWKPLDPTCGALGTGGRYAPRAGAPKPATTPPPPPAPAPRVAPPPPKPSRLSPDTHRGRILAALAHHTSGCATPVAVGDLVVRAWRMSPDAFGLSGHEQHHPDSNAVLARLCGADGLVGMGMIARPRSGMVALTHRGARWWRDVGRPWLAAQGGTR